MQNKRQDLRHHSEVSDWECWHKKPRGEGSTWVLVVYLDLLLMEEILHHLGCIKPMVNNEIFYHIKWDFWTINRTIRKQPYNRSTSAVSPKLLGYRWFGALCFGILEIPLSKNPFHKGDPRHPNHRAPNHQLTIRWIGTLLKETSSLFLSTNLNPNWIAQLSNQKQCSL